MVLDSGDSFLAYTKIHDAKWWSVSGNYYNNKNGPYNYTYQYGGKNGFKYVESSSGNSDLVARSSNTASGSNICVSSWVKNADGAYTFDTTYSCGSEAHTSYTSNAAKRGTDYASVNV